MKELLSQAGVPFSVRNVETDLDAYRALIARGFRTVPVTFVGEEASSVAIVGFNDTALRRALGLPEPAR